LLEQEDLVISLKKSPMSKRILFICAFISCFSFQSKAQIGVSGGIAAIRGFGSGKTFPGLSLGVELPNFSDMTFYLRGNLSLSKAETNLDGTPFLGTTYVSQTTNLTLPSSLSVNYETTFNYGTIEFGTRRYIGNDYDNGFALYGGSDFMLILNSVKRKYEKKDYTGTYTWEPNYTLPANEPSSGRIVCLAVGVEGGMKYTFPGQGSIFADVTANYSLLALPNNNTAANTNLYSPFIMIFNVGYRKEFY
jgi:hypothetical protein